jgi:hypothetical protein
MGQGSCSRTWLARLPRLLRKLSSMKKALCMHNIPLCWICNTDLGQPKAINMSSPFQQHNSLWTLVFMLGSKQNSHEGLVKGLKCKGQDVNPVH